LRNNREMSRGASVVSAGSGSGGMNSREGGNGGAGTPLSVSGDEAFVTGATGLPGNKARALLERFRWNPADAVEAWLGGGVTSDELEADVFAGEAETASRDGRLQPASRGGLSGGGQPAVTLRADAPLPVYGVTSDHRLAAVLLAPERPGSAAGGCSALEAPPRGIDALLGWVSTRLVSGACAAPVPLPTEREALDADSGADLAAVRAQGPGGTGAAAPASSSSTYEDEERDMQSAAARRALVVFSAPDRVLEDAEPPAARAPQGLGAGSAEAEAGSLTRRLADLAMECQAELRRDWVAGRLAVATAVLADTGDSGSWSGMHGAARALRDVTVPLDAPPGDFARRPGPLDMVPLLPGRLSTSAGPVHASDSESEQRSHAVSLPGPLLRSMDPVRLLRAVATAVGGAPYGASLPDGRDGGG